MKFIIRPCFYGRFCWELHDDSEVRRVVITKSSMTFGSRAGAVRDIRRRKNRFWRATVEFEEKPND